jgi:hypothetical protein
MPTQIGVAVSKDGTTWERRTAPLLEAARDGGWMAYGTMDPEVVIGADDVLNVWFDGLGPGGYATIGHTRCREE